MEIFVCEYNSPLIYDGHILKIVKLYYTNAVFVYVRMGTQFYFNYLPVINIMSTIRERSETNSLASSPIQTYSDHRSSVEPDLHLNRFEPFLENIPENVRDYIDELRGIITNMKKQILVQNRYIEDITCKNDSSLDTIVELNATVHDLEKDRQKWRIRARSEEMSSSMFEHDIKELRDTIVSLRRQHIGVAQQDKTPIQQDIIYTSHTPTGSPEYNKGLSANKTNYKEVCPKKHWSQFQGKSNEVDQKGEWGQKINIEINETLRHFRRELAVQPMKRVKNNRSRNINPDFRSIRQRPIDQSLPFVVNSELVNPITPHRLRKLSHKSGMSKPSSSFPDPVRHATPRPTSLTEVQRHEIKLSNIEMTSSKIVYLPRAPILTSDKNPSKPFKKCRRRPNT